MTRYYIQEYADGTYQGFAQYPGYEIGLGITRRDASHEFVVDKAKKVKEEETKEEEGNRVIRSYDL